MKKLIFAGFVLLLILPVCVYANFQSAGDLNFGMINVDPVVSAIVNKHKTDLGLSYSDYSCNNYVSFFELRDNFSLFNSENWFYRITIHSFDYSYSENGYYANGQSESYTEEDLVSYFGLVGINYFINFCESFSWYLGGDAGFNIVIRTGRGNIYNNVGSSIGTISPSNSGSDVFGIKLDTGLQYNINKNWNINLTAGITGGGYFVAIGTGWMNSSQSNGLKKNEDVDKSIVDSDAHTGSSDLPALPESNANSKVDYLVTDGDTKFSAKDYKAALELYNKAVLQEETYELYKKIGSCYFYLGEKESSKSAYKKALKLNPDDSKLKEWLINYK